MIPYSRQQIIDEDIQAVIEVLRSDFLTQGPMVPKFEEAIAKYCGAGYAVAVNNATSALHVACLALGVVKNDIVWTTPITFVATANSALYCGANIDFVDIDHATYNISVDCLERKLEVAKINGNLPKVLIVVHMCGQPCDMESISYLSKEYGFKVIEDASHATGSKYKGISTGSCFYSDITIFSFHPVKIITTGEGGMALTNNENFAKKMRLLRTHGITRDFSEMDNKSDGEWYYEQLELGFNYRMTDIQAALGLSQLKRIDNFIEKRNEIANQYSQSLKDLPIKLPVNIYDIYNSYHLYIVRLKLDRINRTHKEIFNSLRENGVGVNVHYIPVYFQPYYQKLGFSKGYCNEAEKYYSEAISLPIYPDLSDKQQSKVISVLQEVIH